MLSLRERREPRVTKGGIAGVFHHGQPKRQTGDHIADTAPQGATTHQGDEASAFLLEHGITVTPIPGPSALLSALAASGLPTDRFLYLGFLPRVRSDRRKLLASVAMEPYTLVLFEAPHRMLASLEDLEASLGDRPAAAAQLGNPKWVKVLRAV